MLTTHSTALFNHCTCAFKAHRFWKDIIWMNHRLQCKVVGTSYSLVIVFMQWVGKCWKIH